MNHEQTINRNGDKTAPHSSSLLSPTSSLIPPASKRAYLSETELASFRPTINQWMMLRGPIHPYAGLTFQKAYVQYVEGIITDEQIRDALEKIKVETKGSPLVIPTFRHFYCSDDTARAILQVYLENNPVFRRKTK